MNPCIHPLRHRPGGEDQRAVALAEAYERHPEHFARRPRSPEIPGEIWINDPAKRSEPELQSPIAV